MGFGRRTTASEVLQGVDLSENVAVVTGGNSGIGSETVRALAIAGAKVIMTSRDLKAGQAVAERLQEESHGLKGSVIVKHLDLADLHSVKKLANDLNESQRRIDLLVLNAGIMMCPRGYTREGFETHWGTNHVGHFVLVQSLLPKLQKQDHPSRIVVLSSHAHTWHKKPLNFADLDFSRRKYNPRQAYGQSKLANILFVKQLALRLQGTRVTAYAVHPGVVETQLWRYMWPQSSCMAGVFALLARAPIFPVKTAPQGAATSVYVAATPGLEEKSGSYFADCKEVSPSKQASDAKQAEKLWQVTEAQLANVAAQRASMSQSAGNGSGEAGRQQGSGSSPPAPKEGSGEGAADMPATAHQTMAAAVTNGAEATDLAAEKQRADGKSAYAASITEP